MSGRLVGGFILVVSALIGAVIYYLQVYAYYHTIAPGSPEAAVRLVSVVSGQPEPVEITGFEGIDAESSPLRYRSCFRIDNSLSMLSETYQIAEDAEPLIAPGWFSCFDAGAIGAALESGEALAFVSEPEIHPEVERLVAVFPDGRAFAWQQLRPDAEK